MDDNERAWPLIAFTVVGPASVGCLLGAALLSPDADGNALRTEGLTAAWVLGLAAVLFSLAHLTKPRRAYRALRRFPSSPLSREIAAYTLYLVLAGLCWLAELVSTAPRWLLLAAVVAGALAVVASARIYLLPARPTWHHWSTVGTFAGCALSLGIATSLLTGLGALDRLDEPTNLAGARWLVIGGIVLSALSLAARVIYLRSATPDTRAGWRLITAHSVGLWWLRILVGFVVAGVAIALSWNADAWLLVAWPALAVGEVLDRRLFFATAVPLSFRTELPGVR